MVSGKIGSMIDMVVGMIIGIILSIIFFVITLFVIKAAADIVFSGGVGTDMAVIAAAIVTLGSMLSGSGLRKGSI
jgi:hypothetical protein